MHSSEYLLSTCCVPGGTQFNAGVIERKIKAHTLPSRSSQSNVTERCGNEEWNSVWEVLITKTCSKGGQPGIHSTTVSTVKVCGVPPPLRNKCLTWLSSVFQCQCDNGIHIIMTSYKEWLSDSHCWALGGNSLSSQRSWLTFHMCPKSSHSITRRNE